MRFIGLLFVEDFDQGYSKYKVNYSTLRSVWAFISLEWLRELVQYCCITANSQIVFRDMRNIKIASFPESAGIQKPEILFEEPTYSVFHNRQIIHRIYRRIPYLFKLILLNRLVADKYFYDYIRKMQSAQSQADAARICLRGRHKRLIGVARIFRRIFNRFACR